MSFQGEQFDGSVGRAWTHLPWTHQIYSCICNNPVWKIPKNWLSSSSTEGQKAHGDRQDKNCSLAKNPTFGSDPQVGGTSQSSVPLRSKGFKCSLRRSNPWQLHQRDEHPDVWLWTPWKLTSRRWKGLWKTDTLLLKGSLTDSLPLGPSTKTAGWKALSPFLKDSHWPILKVY